METYLQTKRGKVVLVHFWGPNCGPCIREFAKLRALHQKLSGRTDRFAMISFTVGMEAPDWRAYLDGHGMDWPQALLVGKTEKLWDDFRVGFIPDYAVIGPDGTIIADGQSTGLDVDKVELAIVQALGRP